MTQKQTKLPKLAYIPVDLDDGRTVMVSNLEQGGIVVFYPSTGISVFASMKELIDYVVSAPVEEPEPEPKPKLRVVKDPKN